MSQINISKAPPISITPCACSEQVAALIGMCRNDKYGACSGLINLWPPLINSGGYDLLPEITAHQAGNASSLERKNT
jgi:hypothetical protein